ncbi:hypothetical protein EKE94_05150 [Mesobaculum littorinae]|uniref:Uncharacterized protein n=1 Tax=Mesobaculum littorinae TaxID=2486419 RepID=A0A438AI63_9RHOB|nr:hypothetical protein [Mesobaculum littorinae]RVV98318.1 hypothetical protein EKE94_05150 [Mesobaculum littorinae]
MTDNAHTGTLAARVFGADAIPATVTGLTLILRQTPAALARGLRDEVLDELDFALGDIGALLATGYGALAEFDPSGLSIHCRPEPETGLTIEVTGARHGALLPNLLIRALHGLHQTPAGSFDRLLAMLDGDEAAARDSHDPKDFSALVKRIDLSVQGEGPHAPLPLDLPPPSPDAAALVDALSRTDAARTFRMPAGAQHLSERAENGLMSLWSFGALQSLAAPAPDDDEPLFTLDRDAEGTLCTVEGWSAAPVHLAETLRCMCQERGTGIVALDDA